MSADDAASLRAHLSEAITATDPTLRDRLLTDPDAYLDLVALTARARTETDVLLRLAVAGARAAGCTWGSVGGVLGVPRQEAQQRYGAAADEPGAAVTGAVTGGYAGGDTGGNAGGYAGGGAGGGTVAEDVPAAHHPAVADPDDPTARIHQISWLNSFTEMKALEKAGRYGWHLVGTGSGIVIVRKSEVQWEHQRVFASRAAGRALEEQGWLRCGSASFPHAYYKRPTGEPALSEPPDDGYLGRG